MRANHLNQLDNVRRREFCSTAFLLWNRQSFEVTEEEALSLYEANRQWVEPASMSESERQCFLARTVIDLIMLEHKLGELPAVAWTKAREAYGDSIERIYYRALQRLRDEPAFLQRVFDALSITESARTVIRERLSKSP